jgi:hypothetical protein
MDSLSGSGEESSRLWKTKCFPKKEKTPTPEGKSYGHGQIYG